MKKRYYIGLDVGTNSVGYAVTDKRFQLMKDKGEPMWGAHVFEGGQNCADRRSHRTARRRLNRRQQRIYLTQQIFAKAIAEVDDRFFIRVKESALFREDTSGKDSYIFFQDETYTDKDYHKEYPTIHHLIKELMQNDTPHDVRLVYLAVVWLMAHRGHFLSEVEKDNVEELLDFDMLYENFMELFSKQPWICSDIEKFKQILLSNQTVRNKERMFWDLLYDGKRPKTEDEDVLSKEALVKLLSGGTVDAAKLFCQRKFGEKLSLSLRKPEEDFQMSLSELEEDAEYLIRLRAIYDWSLLVESLHGCASISEAKVKDYEQHKADLLLLKDIVRKYCPEQYSSIFKAAEKDNYTEYVYNLPKEKRTKDYKKATKEEFCDYLRKKLKNISCEPEDQKNYQDMMSRLETYTFMPKQVNGDNRVNPCQLYYHELKCILKNAETYLPFLLEVDEDGIDNIHKLLSVFEFRVPYYVGPLCEASEHAWIRRKAEGKIYPWNFQEKVDLDASEDAFIKRMTNNCSYLPGENVVSRNSLLYCKFMVLNEINNIKVNGSPISVECKQEIYELFKQYKKVTVERIRNYLISNNYMTKDGIIDGIDVTIKASLKSYHDFRRLMQSGTLNEKQVERIIEILTYSEDRARIVYRLKQEFPELSEADKKYLSKLKYTGFGRLSRRFLVGLQGVAKETGESFCIMEALWETNENMMQLLSERYTFKDTIVEEQKEYYQENPRDIEMLMEEMYLSNAVKRSIYRTLDVVRDIKSVCKDAPEKIFVEMARWREEEKTTTTSRRDQIQELYRKMDSAEVRELSKQLEGRSDRELRSEVLFLYFMQFGRSMYSNKPIDITKLKTDAYNVDHIYPQCRVKDDSISNKVLVLSEENGAKGDKYPIDVRIRNNMFEIWRHYHEIGAISDEKYRRLIRTTSFSDSEKMNFIHRQLVETQQSTKALTKILQYLFPETEIVYVKAGLVSEFRHEFGIVKSRSINDLHHAKDAYLNIVVGEVYNARFSEKFFKIDRDEYSVKTKVIFGNRVWRGKELVWEGEKDVARVKKISLKNFAHYTRYAFERRGSLFDQNPVRAAEGLIERKQGLETGKYGGYNKPTASCFLLVKYTEIAKKPKKDMILVPVDLMSAEKIVTDERNATEYAVETIAQIMGKEKDIIQEVSFPLGMRKIKVNTVVSLDGFEVSIAGKSSGGKQILLGSMVPLVVDYKKERYIKLLENFSRKKKENASIMVEEVYDGIGIEKNIELYSFFTKKLEQKPFCIVFGGQLDILKNGVDKFERLTIEEQVEVLLRILAIFQNGRTTGCDLDLLCGKKSVGVVKNSSKISNWKKAYTDVRIIDVSPTGLHRKISDNILELL